MASFEHLENRELLSAYTVTVTGNALRIDGTPHKDCLYVTQNIDHVEIKQFCRDTKKAIEIVPGVFNELVVDLGSGDDKLVTKAFQANVDIYLGEGNDTVRYYDSISPEFCVDAGPGNDTAKARRNTGALYMLDGGEGIDSLINRNNNKWDVKDLRSVEKEKLIK